MIQARLPDGRILQFPVGTDPAVIQATVKRILDAGKAAPQFGADSSVDSGFIRDTLLNSDPLEVARQRQEAKRAELSNISANGDIGRTEIEDPGYLKFLGEAVKEQVAGPAIGLAERTGRVIRDFEEEHPILAQVAGLNSASPIALPAGIATTLADLDLRQNVREGYESTREDYLAADPSAGRALLAGGTELAAGVAPFIAAPSLNALEGGPLAASAGQAAARLAGRVAPSTFEAGSAASRLLSRGVAGGIEGGVVGLGNADPDAPLADQAREIGLSAALGGGLGALGGAKEIAKLSDQGQLYPSGRVVQGPPAPPSPEVRQRLLDAFEAEKAQVKDHSTLDPALLPEAIPAAQEEALRAVNARWQRVWAEAGAAGDEQLARLADEQQGVNATDVRRLSEQSIATADNVIRDFPETPTLRPRVASWATSSEESLRRFQKFADAHRGEWLPPDVLPFEARDLPLTRWAPNHETGSPIRAGASYFTLGDDALHYSDTGQRTPYSETFTPQNPVVVMRRPEVGGSPQQDIDLVRQAEKRGHDAVILVNANAQSIEVVKTRHASQGVERASPWLGLDKPRIIGEGVAGRGTARPFRAPVFETEEQLSARLDTEGRGEQNDLRRGWRDFEERGWPALLREPAPSPPVELPDLGRSRPTGLTGVYHQNPSADLRGRFPDAQIDSRDAYAGPVNTGRERRARPRPGTNSESGFITLPGRGAPPPASPIETVMPRRQVPAEQTVLGRLQAVADRVTDQWLNKEDAPLRRARRAGAPETVVRELESLQKRARGAGGMVDPSRRAGPVFEGTYIFDRDLDLGNGQRGAGSRRTGDGLEAIVGGLDDEAHFDLDSLMAAEHHLELVARRDRARLEFEWQRAQRLEALRQARREDAISLRAMAGDIRTDQATAIQAARREARARGEYRAFLTSEGRVGRASSLRRDLGPAETSTDLAARRLGSSIQPANAARTDALRSIRSAQRVAMGIRDQARKRVPPPPTPHPDAKLDIDDDGTAIANWVIQDLAQRYGAGPDGRVAPQLADLADRVREWSIRAFLMPLKTAGRLSDQEFWYRQSQDGAFEFGGAILAKNARYAPFFRLVDRLGQDPEILVGTTKADPLKSISGGLSPKRPVGRPLESFVQQAQRVTLWAERQHVRNSFADVVDATPEMQKEIVKLADVPGDTARPQGGTFVAWRDGKRYEYAAPADVVLAFERLTPKQAGHVAQLAAIAARTLRAGATVTLEFPFRNLGRDVQDSAIYGPGVNPVYRLLIDPVAGLLEAARNGKWAQEWRANGGALSGATAVARPQVEAIAKDVVDPSFAGRMVRRWHAENPAGKLAFPVLYPLETLAETLEAGAKIGSYRRARLRGAAPLDAAAMSRDVSSPDFGRSGTTGGYWNQFEAFFNAELQDIFRLGQAFRRRPVATTVKAMAYLTIPAIANWAKNRDDPEYQDLPEWEKVSFYHPAKLEGGRWVRIPRPLGLINLAFSYGPQKLIEGQAGQDPDAAEHFARSFVHATPLHYASTDAAPSIAQPLLEATAGPGGWSQFRDAPMVGQGLQGMLPAEQVNDHTSGIARAIGGAEWPKTGISMIDNAHSPLKIDYLIQGYGATWGKTLAQATGPAARALGGDPADSDSFMGRMAQGGSPTLPIQPSDVPGVRGFISTPAIGFGSDPVTRFYKASTEAAQAAQSLKQAEDAGDIARYQAILREHPEVMLADDMSALRKELTEMRKERNEYQKMPGWTPEQRLEAVLMIDQMATQRAGLQLHQLADFLRGQR